MDYTLASENISILTVKRRNYEEALVIASRYNVSPNDAVAALISRDNNIAEVYSFDKHFENIPFIKRTIK